MANENYTAEIQAKRASVKQAEKLATLLLGKINEVSGTSADGIKHVALDDGALKFYKAANPAADATPDFSLDLPEEYFLDQAKTTFVQSFDFAGGNYTGATDPNLDGKPVMVLAVKGQKANSVSYSFVDLAALADTGKMDKVTSATADNFAAFDASGNIKDSGKNAASFSKVTASATNGNINVDGTDITVYTPNDATDEEFDEMLIHIGLLSAPQGA